MIFSSRFMIVPICLLCLFFGPVSVRGGGPVTVGALFSETGTLVGQNEGGLIGIRLAVDEINASGGVNGRQLRLAVFDIKSSAIGAMIAARAAAGSEAVAVVGPAWSSHALAAGRVAQESGMPMIAPMATHDAVTRIGPYVFRVCYSDHQQASALASLARKILKVGTVAMAVDVSSDFSLNLSESFRQEYQALGGKVVLDVQYKAGRDDFSYVARSLARSGAEAILLAGHDESGVIAKKLTQAGVDVPLLGGDGWQGNYFMRLGGKAVRRGYYCSHWDMANDRKVSGDFIRKFGERYDLDADMALGYDAMMVLASAMRRAPNLTRSKIREALAATTAHSGVTGEITFDGNGDPFHKKVVIMRIYNGRRSVYRLITPPPYGKE